MLLTLVWYCFIMYKDMKQLKNVQNSNILLIKNEKQKRFRIKFYLQPDLEQKRGYGHKEKFS